MVRDNEWRPAYDSVSYRDGRSVTTDRWRVDLENLEILGPWVAGVERQRCPQACRPLELGASLTLDPSHPIFA